MADKKITGLVAAAAAAATQLFEVVTDPAGVPVSEKLSVTQLATFLRSLAETLTNKTIDSASNTITLAASTITSGLLSLARMAAPTGTGIAMCTGGVWNAATTVTLQGGNGGTGLNGSSLIGSAGRLLQVNGTEDNYVTLALGAGFATFMTTPSSANLLAALTDKTGTGVNVFATSPTLVTPVLGAATCTTLAFPGVVATAGDMRVAGGFSIISAVGGVNRPLIQATTGAEVVIGGFAASECGGIYARVNSGSFRIQIDGNNELIHTNTGPQFGRTGSTDHGGGVGVIGIDNATTNPTTNPTAGFILYSDGGALKGRSPSGLNNTIHAAEPHCPRCGTDMGISESRNDMFGEYLVHCHSCEIRRGNGVVKHVTNFFEHRKAA